MTTSPLSPSPSAVLPSARGLLIEFGPAALLMSSLLIKLVVANRWFSPWPVASVSATATAAAVLLLYAPLGFISRRWRIAAATTINVAATTLMLSDLTYYSFFRDVLSVNQFFYAWMLPSVWASVRASLTVSHLWMYADVFICVAASPLYFRAIRGRPYPRARIRLAASAAWCAAMLVLAWPSATLARTDPDNVVGWRSSRTQFVSAFGLLPYHLFDLSTYVMSVWTGHRVTAADRAEVKAALQARHSSKAADSPLFGVARGKNLILVQAESLQMFPIGLQLYGQPIAPNLAAFAAQSLAFTNFHDQTFGGATSDSVFMSLQSLYALGPGEGAVATRYLTSQYHGLPAVLSSQGYLTLAAMGADGKSWLIGDLLKRLGFKRTYLDETYHTSERFGQGVADGVFFRDTVPMLLRERQPFAAFLVSVSNHHPYDLPARYRGLHLGALEGSTLGRYLDSVHYFDSAFGQFIADLRRHGLLDRSVVVVYGDHQGWLDDNEELARLIGFDPTDRFQFWKTRKRVPLFIRLPNAAAAGVREVAGGHADIAPTALSLLGVESDPVMLGGDLTAGKQPLVVFRDGSLAADGKYLINDAAVGSEPSCFEISTGAQVNCAALQNRQREASETVRVSDLVIRGNLVPQMRAAVRVAQ